MNGEMCTMSSQEKTDIEPKRLLIIGNGFDLHCGLHSSFRDFISAKYGEQTESNPMMVISQKNEKIKEMMRSRTSINAIKHLSNWIPIVAHENLWTAWLTFLRCCQGTTKNWADVESQMTTLLTNHTVEKVLKQNENVFEDDLKSESDSVFFFLVLLKGIFGNANYISGLKNELTKFEASMMVYMNQQVHENQPYFTHVKESIEQLTKLGIEGERNTEATRPEPFNLLNFNYTNIESSLQDGDIGIKSGLHPIIQRNIHGTTVEHAVIGIDATDVHVDSPIVLFTKTYRLLEKQEIGYEGKTNAVLSPEIHTIVFYGHSLSNNDFAYFQSIFDVYHVYDSKVLLIFAYSIYDQTEEMHIKERLYHAIQKLLDRYGRSLGNENHRQNLMHRLIIENRLLLKRV